MSSESDQQSEGNQAESQKTDSVPFHIFDTFGYEMVSDTSTARAFLEYFLRKNGYHDLADLMEGADVDVLPTRHVKGNLHQTHSDIWLKVTTRGENPLVFRVQIEVKGGNEPDAPLQIAGNHIEDAKKVASSGETAPDQILRFSVLLNLGRTVWSEEVSVEGMFPKQEILGRLAMRNESLLADLRSMTLEEVRKIPHRRLSTFLSVCRCAIEQLGEDDLVWSLEDVDLNNLREVESIVVLLRRLYSKLRLAMVQRALNRSGIGSEVMESIEDAAEQRGEARGETRGEAIGEARGEARGKAKMFLQFARQKFVRIPDHWEQQVHSATPTQIEIWAKRLPDAADLESMFNGDD